MRDEAIRAVVAIDTSGSTSCELPRFFSELTGLMKSFGKYDLTVIQCDASISKVEKFSDTSPLDPEKKIEVFGFGGTDFKPVFDYIKKGHEQPEVLIYVTDGWGDAPEHPPAYPVLWVLTSNGKQPADWGKSVFLHD
jgi:predicted metal-dependent peptidase